MRKPSTKRKRKKRSIRRCRPGWGTRKRARRNGHSRILAAAEGWQRIVSEDGGARAPAGEVHTYLGFSSGFELICGPKKKDLVSSLASGSSLGYLMPMNGWSCSTETNAPRSLRTFFLGFQSLSYGMGFISILTFLAFAVSGCQ